MHGRFKMEYRLFTIVRYNYRDYNIKDEHRYSFQSEKREQLATNKNTLFNFCQDRRVHRISNFKSVFHHLLAACLAFLSQLGLSSSAHDCLLVTFLTTMPISISSVSSIVSRVLAPGNSLREPKAHSTPSLLIGL
jgi:hypothetical protein